MRIEQALYGEADGGHALLGASKNDEVARGIVQRLDLPDAAPLGVDWSPFLRGFAYLDRYVLSRSFLDSSAARGGMVFAHALIAPLDEITRVSDLRPLLKFLATNERTRPAAKAIELADMETQFPDAEDLMDAAEALASATDLPVVRVGYGGFDQLVAALWARLLPEMRRNFAFRLSFGPRDLVEDIKPALVCTPHEMAGRWTGYRLIGPCDSLQPTSLASAVLSGRGNAAPLLEFMREIAVEPATFAQLGRLEQACRLYKEEPTAEVCIRAVRLLESLSPDPGAGTDLKERLVQRLQTAMAKATPEQILLMRNLRLSAFPSPGRVWQTLKKWVAENIYPQDQDAQILSAIEKATSDGAVLEWRTAILDGLAAAARARKSNFRNGFWRWMQTCPGVVDAALGHVMAEDSVETSVAEAAPRCISPRIANEILALARSRGWLRVHGAVLSAAFSPLDAARQQLAIDSDLSFMEGIRPCFRNAKPEEVLNCALEIGDPRTTILAGEAAARDLELLTQVDFRERNAQAVWREAIVIDVDSWRGPSDPMAAFHAVLDGLLEGAETDSSLIHRLSLTPVADLCSYPRRAELWLRVDSPILNNLLAATAEGWLWRACRGHVSFEAEPALQSAILSSDEFEPALSELIPDRLGTAIRVIAALDSCEEERFRRLTNGVLTRSTVLTVPDAEEVGRLIQDRNWKATAFTLVEQYQSGRQDLEPALRAFHNMLDLWTRFWLGIKPLSENEKWEAFETLAAELYSDGPSEEEVWERAGGKKEDLSFHGSGRSQWRKALRKVRRGIGVSPNSILEVMEEDFPGNQRIPRLASVFNKGKSDEEKFLRSHD